jgi:DNA polymerase-1
MRHHIFEENPNGQYKVAILIKGTSFYKQELINAYLEPLARQGVAAREVIAFTLDYNDNDKAPAGHIKDYLSKLLPALDRLGVTHLYIADSAYFKTVAGVPKAEPHHGYALPVKFKLEDKAHPGFGHMTCVLGLNYRQLIFNPDLQPKVDNSIKALASAIAGTYQAPGQGIIHSASYPTTLKDIRDALARLHQFPRLTSDIEGFSLHFAEAGVGTIAFAWSKHEGVAFCVDWDELRGPTLPEEVTGHEYGRQVTNHDVRRLLVEFFETYQGEIIWHNGTGYDIKVLIAQLWMADLADTAGLLEGLEVMTRRVHDTKIIAYLATNTTAGNVLGLKPLAHEFAGNWAVEEIKDIRRLPKDKLLQYNLVDALSTFYVFEKYYPIMVADRQEELYYELMLPSAQMLIATELTGLPLSKRRVQEVKAKLEAIRQENRDKILASQAVADVNRLIRRSAWEKDYADRKGKAKNPDKILPKQIEAFDDLVFNPNSDPQKRRLFHEVMGLPVLDTTDTGMAATGADTVKKLINHTQDAAHKEVLEAIIILDGVSTILDTFIPAFEKAISHGGSDPDIVWLHGNFNLGGTVSGRLSSSDPNLTNIPAKVTIKVGGVKIDLGKLVKYCFVSPPGWLFTGADFNSLEDYISALTTKDPNKLRVYLDGYDGHSLRAYAYFKDDLPEIRQASEEDRCFRIKSGNSITLCKSGDLIITPEGKTMRVEDYFEANTEL